MACTASRTRRSAATGRGVELLLGGFDASHDQQIFRKAVHAHRVLENGAEELSSLRAEAGLVVEEGFDISGDRGQRSAQLVGDVGDEVSLGALQLFDAGDVVEDGDCSSAGHRGRVHFKDSARKQGGGTAFADDAVLQSRLNALEYVGIANGLDQGMSDAHGPGG